jgi:hypothetical protein
VGTGAGWGKNFIPDRIPVSALSVNLNAIASHGIGFPVQEETRSVLRSGVLSAEVLRTCEFCDAFVPARHAGVAIVLLVANYLITDNYKYAGSEAWCLSEYVFGA